MAIPELNTQRGETGRNIFMFFQHLYLNILGGAVDPRVFNSRTALTRFNICFFMITNIKYRMHDCMIVCMHKCMYKLVFTCILYVHYNYYANVL